MPDEDYMELFDYCETDYNILIGVAIDSKKTINYLSNDGAEFDSYQITDDISIYKDYIKDLQSVIDYCGIKSSIDTILDELFENTCETRKLYLESVLYYKTNQEGRLINEFNLNFKHFDDFLHQHSEDIYSYDILSNNEDFSESNVIISTHLTREELSKFDEFLI